MATGDGTFHRLIDIQGKFRNMTFTANSPVSTTEITEEITRTESYVQGKIQPFYTIADIAESTAPIAFNIVREICTLYSSGKLNEILHKNGMQPVSEGENTRSDSMILRAEKMLKGIQLFATVGNVDNALALCDIDPKSLPTSNSATGQGTSTPIFDKDIEQW